MSGMTCRLPGPGYLIDQPPEEGRIVTEKLQCREAPCAVIRDELGSGAVATTGFLLRISMIRRKI